MAVYFQGRGIRTQMTEMKHLHTIVIDANTLGLSVYGMDDDFKRDLGIDHMSAADIITLIKNTHDASRLFNEIGMTGGYYTKTIGGNQYVILTGYPGLRRYLRGTRYLPNNPQMVKFGIGPVAQAAASKANFIISMTTYTGLDVIKYISGDGITLSEVTGNAIFNAASTWLSIAVASAVTAGVGAVTTMALPGVLAGLAVGAFVSGFTAAIDEDLRLSSKLAKLIEATVDAFDGSSAARPVTCGLSIGDDATDIEWSDSCKPKVGGGGGAGDGGGSGDGSGDNDGYDDGYTEDGIWHDGFGNDWDFDPGDEDYNQGGEGIAPPEIEIDVGGGGMITTPIDPSTGLPIGPSVGDPEDFQQEIDAEDGSGS